MGSSEAGITIYNLTITILSTAMYLLPSKVLTMGKVLEKIDRMTGSPHASRTEHSKFEHNPGALYASQPANPGGSPGASKKITKVLDGDVAR
jgi:hypothetical protein